MCDLLFLGGFRLWANLQLDLGMIEFHGQVGRRPIAREACVAVHSKGLAIRHGNDGVLGVLRAHHAELKVEPVGARFLDHERGPDHVGGGKSRMTVGVVDTSDPA